MLTDSVVGAPSLRYVPVAVNVWPRTPSSNGWHVEIPSSLTDRPLLDHLRRWVLSLDSLLELGFDTLLFSLDSTCGLERSLRVDEQCFWRQLSQHSHKARYLVAHG